MEDENNSLKDDFEESEDKVDGLTAEVEKLETELNQVRGKARREILDQQENDAKITQLGVELQSSQAELAQLKQVYEAYQVYQIFVFFLNLFYFFVFWLPRMLCLRIICSEITDVGLHLKCLP